MSKAYKKISVFLDTNILQTFIESHQRKSNVFLSNLGIPKEYYALTDFVLENSLQDYVEICIPEVVIKELRQHMINKFNQYCDKLTNDIDYYTKYGGDILEISYKIKISKDDYPGFVDKLIEEFIHTPRNRCNLISTPHNENMIDTLINKSLRGVKPFANQGIDGKTFKDGGFKDSVIAETIYSHCEQNERIGLLISNDGDFGQKFETVLSDASAFVKCTTIEQAILFLKKYYETSIEDRLTREFTENTYWHEYLLTDIGQQYDNSVTDVSVESVCLKEENLYDIKISFVVNEAKYIFTVCFESLANDIVNYSYVIEND